MIKFFNSIWQWGWRQLNGKPHFDRIFWLHGIVGFSVVVPIIVAHLSLWLVGIPKILGAVIVGLSVIMLIAYIGCVSIGIWRVAGKNMSPDIYWGWRWMARGYLFILAYSVILKMFRLGFFQG